MAQGAVRRRPRAIRKAAMALLRDLEITPPIDLDELCRRFGEHRGRPVRRIPCTFPQPSVFGLWLGTATCDLVLHEQNATPDHQRHIVLHELGHILLDHRSEDLDDAVWTTEAWTTLAPTLPTEMVRTALYRSAYDTDAEHQAEMFASVIAEWHGAVDALDTRTTSAIERAFDDPKGWL